MFFLNGDGGFRPIWICGHFYQTCWYLLRKCFIVIGLNRLAQLLLQTINLKLFIQFILLENSPLLFIKRTISCMAS